MHHIWFLFREDEDVKGGENVVDPMRGWATKTHSGTNAKPNAKWRSATRHSKVEQMKMSKAEGLSCQVRSDLNFSQIHSIYYYLLFNSWNEMVEFVRRETRSKNRVLGGWAKPFAVISVGNSLCVWSCCFAFSHTPLSFHILAWLCCCLLYSFKTHFYSSHIRIWNVA